MERMGGRRGPPPPVLNEGDGDPLPLCLMKGMGGGAPSPVLNEADGREEETPPPVLNEGDGLEEEPPPMCLMRTNRSLIWKVII